MWFLLHLILLSIFVSFPTCKRGGRAWRVKVTYVNNVLCGVSQYCTSPLVSFIYFLDISICCINVNAYCYIDFSRAGGISAIYSAVFETIVPTLADENLGTVVSSTGPHLKDMIVKALSKKTSLLDFNSLTFDTGTWTKNVLFNYILQVCQSFYKLWKNSLIR